MSKHAIVIFGCLLTASVFAQDSAAKMTADELRSFLPGTKVTHIVASSGSERHWTNEKDGTLYANTNNKQFGNAVGTLTGGHAGTWTVNDEGKYCIDIDWKRLHEKWCAFVLKGQGDTYYLNVADDKHQIIFAK